MYITISTEASFLEYWPSSIAAAAILCVANELPSLSSAANPHESPETWCDGLSKVGIVNFGWIRICFDKTGELVNLMSYVYIFRRRS